MGASGGVALPWGGREHERCAAVPSPGGDAASLPRCHGLTRPLPSGVAPVSRAVRAPVRRVVHARGIGRGGAGRHRGSSRATSAAGAFASRYSLLPQTHHHVFASVLRRRTDRWRRQRSCLSMADRYLRLSPLRESVADDACSALGLAGWGGWASLCQHRGEHALTASSNLHPLRGFVLRRALCMAQPIKAASAPGGSFLPCAAPSRFSARAAVAAPRWQRSLVPRSWVGCPWTQRSRRRRSAGSRRRRRRRQRGVRGRLRRWQRRCWRRLGSTRALLRRRTEQARRRQTADPRSVVRCAVLRRGAARGGGWLSNLRRQRSADSWHNHHYAHLSGCCRPHPHE